jgi:hypothetical protein
MIEESIDIICHRIAIINEYNKLIHDMQFRYSIYRCYFSEIFDYELNKWTGVKSISYENYNWLEYAYPKYKLYKKIISSWEASHHKQSSFQSGHYLEETFKTYESQNYTVKLDSNYLNFKYFAKRFKFTPSCQ